VENVFYREVTNYTTSEVENHSTTQSFFWPGLGTNLIKTIKWNQRDV